MNGILRAGAASSRAKLTSRASVQCLGQWSALEVSARRSGVRAHMRNLLEVVCFSIYFRLTQEGERRATEIPKCVVRIATAQRDESAQSYARCRH